MCNMFNENVTERGVKHVCAAKGCDIWTAARCKGCEEHFCLYFSHLVDGLCDGCRNGKKKEVKLHRVDKRLNAFNEILTTARHSIGLSPHDELIIEALHHLRCAVVELREEMKGEKK